MGIVGLRINQWPHIRYCHINGVGNKIFCYFNVTLKKVFGKPTIDSGNGDGKIRKYWIVKIDGIVCTIYDWKQGKSYRGYRPLKNARWSVGGSHPISRRLVQGVIDEWVLNTTI